MPTLFEEDVTRENTAYRIDRDGPLNPVGVTLGPIYGPPLDPAKWGDPARVIQLVDVNAVFLFSGSDRRHGPIGVQDAYQVGGGSVNITPFCRNPTAVDLSEVLLTKHNVATYHADHLEARVHDGVLEVRFGHWCSKACEDDEGQCGMECGMEYQEMTYSGRFLVQWAPA